MEWRGSSFVDLFHSKITRNENEGSDHIGSRRRKSEKKRNIWNHFQCGTSPKGFELRHFACFPQIDTFPPRWHFDNPTSLCGSYPAPQYPPSQWDLCIVISLTGEMS